MNIEEEKELRTTFLWIWISGFFGGIAAAAFTYAFYIAMS